MAISKAKRARRKELRELRSRKCRSHGLTLCEWRDCKKQVYEDFYGTRKKKLMHDNRAAVDIEMLFRKLRQPVQSENGWDDLADEPTPVPQPVSAVPPTAAPARVTDPRKMTLRERIALNVAA